MKAKIVANLKIFVSSTCYDLSMIREQLKKFIENIGHVSVLSDYSDILYDPREHTHTSCIQEVQNTDMLILIIGSRYGGKSVPEALKEIDFDKLKQLDDFSKLLETKNELSITQLEVLKAIELDIPIYIFVDDKVKHEHYVYSKNKDIKGMTFPSIDKQESAQYIFSFIDFLQHRIRNNNIMKYSKFEDIEEQLKKQWSAYFQRLLQEQQNDVIENKNFTSLTEQMNDLKVALISTLSNKDAKEIARGTIEFRRLIDVFTSLKIREEDMLSDSKSILDLLKSINVKSFIEIDVDKIGRGNFILIKENKTVILSRSRLRVFQDMDIDFDRFKQLTLDVRKVIIDTLQDSNINRGFSTFSIRPIKIKEYLKENFDKNKHIDLIKSKKSIEKLF